MSAAPAANQAEGDAPKKGKKKLILIVVGVLVVLLLAGAGALFMMKKSMASHDAEAEGGAEQASQAEEPKDKVDHNVPPVFVPLEPFVVNLADRGTERFAQIGINLQVDEASVSDKIKLYMPAIRNAILLILSHKTAEELLTTEGKVQLAGEIQRGAARAMGYDIEEPEEVIEQPVDAEAEEPAPPPKKRKKKKVETHNPIVQVHYANFIIQ